MIDLPLDDLRDAAGFGVAGNLAGHLEQAGEAADFAGVAAASQAAPKGIFPWYLPGRDDFLGVFPLANARLSRPASADGPVNLQIEPEVGIVCAVGYRPDGRRRTIAPAALGAFNDCSIRRPGAAKISHKKNGGAGSKGLAAVTSSDGVRAAVRDRREDALAAASVLRQAVQAAGWAPGRASAPAPRRRP